MRFLLGKFKNSLYKRKILLMVTEGLFWGIIGLFTILLVDLESCKGFP